MKSKLQPDQITPIQNSPIHLPAFERKTVEHSLIGEDYLDIILQSSNQGIWDYNIKTGEKYHSTIWYKIRGLDPKDSVEENYEKWLELIHPNDQILAKQMTEAINSGKIEDVNYEYRERHTDGRWVWIMCRGSAIRETPNGPIVRFAGTDTDITRLKQAEEHQKQLTDRLDLAAEIANIGIWEFDTDSETVTWDRRLRAIYELPPTLDKLPQDIWEKSLHPEDIDRCKAITEEHVNERKDFALDYRIITGTGKIKHISSRVMFRAHSSQNPILLGVDWDVTGLKESEARLTQANIELYKRNQELETARQNLERKSTIDPLTGVYNRYKIEELIEQDKYKLKYSTVLHLDLDRFKEINDVIGHAAGDYVLQHCAKVLTRCCNDESTIIRVGGDEFVVYFQRKMEKTELETLCRNIISQMSTPCYFKGQLCRVSASIGVSFGTESILSDGAEDVADSIFIRADQALYSAKEKGRNRFEVFCPKIQEIVTQRKHDADAFLAGLEERQFFVMYQPQFSLQTGSFSGVEALARWLHPTRGVINAAEFISIASTLNALAVLDGIVFDEALRTAQDLHLKGASIPRLSINLSKERLGDQKLIEDFTKLGPLPFVVSCELLETIVLDEATSPLLQIIEHLRSFGAEIELDDFGSAHASIQSLVNVAPHRIKIDRNIVSSIGKLCNQEKLLKAIVDIAHIHSAATIAEGVESIAQLELLSSLGCDEAQGYALTPPMTDYQLLEFIKHGARPSTSLQKFRSRSLVASD